MISSNAKIYELANPPTDSVSELAFSNHHNMMIASSWDGTISLYNPTIQTGFLKNIPYTKPMLSCAFSKENPVHCFGGSADGNLHFVDLEKNITNNIKAHNDGIRSVKSQYNTVITAYCDKTIKIWDTRSAQCTKTVECDGKIFCMDLQNNLIAYATSTNLLYSSNVNNLDTKKKHTPKFNYMLKCISVGTDEKSVLVGGIEGKCEMINISSYYNGISFRSHRKDLKVFSVNTVGLYPKNPNVLATGGSNGDLIFYDNMSRIKTFSKTEDVPITTGAFNTDGKLYAYCLGDDWATGYDGVYRKTSIKIIGMDSLGIKV
ncbi:mRNA export factor (GLE2) [Vairimorpha necatrix]|uniref:mRNA export factor (GLE2) n=1 Tax=Vairimorpha necatrix TaxID=6039 RepID=A0AAX4JBY5_9MICR